MSRHSVFVVLGVVPATLTSGAPVLQAQDVKVSAIVDLWYTQTLDNNLRLNTAAGKYFQLNGAFLENGFTVRRSELYLNGKISDELSYAVMFDPNITTSTTNPTILQDAAITWKLNSAFSVKVGQFKPVQTFEGSLVGSGELLFWDRSQLARHFGDKRDRGALATYAWGETAGLSGKVNLGLFNGSGDKDGGKANDANAQKDMVTRFEFAYGKTQKFGFYTRNGSTDASDKGGLVALAFAGAGAPTAAAVLDAKDKINNLGAYYSFENATWIAQGEFISGQLGRRFASVGTATGAALRQHLDQKFFGYVVSGGYKTGRHAFLLRYDSLNYNQGTDFYGPYNPYTQNTTTGAALNGDFTPTFTELIAGWNYTFTPSKWTLANFKLNYIHRSKNFLLPRAGQSGAQGGDSLLAAFQVGF